MPTTLKNIKRKKYRLRHPERLLLVIAGILAVVLAIILLTKGKDSTPQESVGIIEESHESLESDAQKASVGLGEVKTQIQGAIEGILGDNKENHAKDPDSQPEESWQQQNYTYCLVLDAGHGGDDPGNMKGESYEKDINLAVALQVRDYIQRTDPRIKVVMIRTKDENVDGRRQIADAAQPDMVVSLHCNAYPGTGVARGTEALYWAETEEDPIGKLSYEAAEKLIAAAASGFGFSERRPLKADNTLLNHSPVPAVLIEMGFLSDPDDDAALNDPAMQAKGGASIGQAIIDLLYTYEPRNNQANAGNSEPAGE